MIHLSSSTNLTEIFHLTDSHCIAGTIDHQRHIGIVDKITGGAFKIQIDIPLIID